MDKKNQRQSLIQFAKNLEKQLKAKAPVNSGKLKKSINVKVVRDNIDVDMLAYGEFQDMGVSGIKRKFDTPFSFTNKKPPAMLAFGKMVGINGFALRNSIFERGIKPTLFITKTLDSMDDFAADYADSIWADFEESLDKK